MPANKNPGIENTNYDELLNTITANWEPCNTESHSDKTVSAGDIQNAIMMHTGEEVTLQMINAFMKAAGFTPHFTIGLQFVYLIKYKA